MDVEDRTWRLNEDLSTQDSLLDGITFDELITTVRCNRSKITPEIVKSELNKIVEEQIDNMNELLERNMDVIIEEAVRWRGVEDEIEYWKYK